MSTCPDRSFWTTESHIVCRTSALRRKQVVPLTWYLDAPRLLLTYASTDLDEVVSRSRSAVRRAVTDGCIISFSLGAEPLLLSVLQTLRATDPRVPIVLISCMMDETAMKERLLAQVRAVGCRVVAFFSTHCEENESRVRLVPLFSSGWKPTWAHESPHATDEAEQDAFVYVNFTVVYRTNGEYNKEAMRRAMWERMRVEQALMHNGFRQRKIVPYEQMLRDMERCVYCICPRGIGPDTHRLWEALSVGCAVVSHDWPALRRAFPGTLPALWVVEDAPAARVAEWRERLWVDERGEVYAGGWSHVRRDVLTQAYRFVGWKRSSTRLRMEVLSAAYWRTVLYRALSERRPADADMV